MKSERLSAQKICVRPLVVLFRFIILCVIIGTIWVVLESNFTIGKYIPRSIRDKLQLTTPQTSIGPIIQYANCKKIPPPPQGSVWVEDIYFNDPRVTTLDVLPDPALSQIWLEGNDRVMLGNTIHIHLKLYDTKGNLRSSGGDLVRVWIRDKTNGAAASTKVVDNGDGSYSATTVAFWVGEPEIVAAIITPREIRALVLRRRYICPPIIMNTALFEHPVDSEVKEITPCNYYSEIPGYKTLCNFTGDNYGRPWYCGKPKNQSLMCNDWTKAMNTYLLSKGTERWNYSSLEMDILTSPKYQAMVIPKSLKIIVEPKSSNATISRIKPEVKCNELPVKQTWVRNPPTGYLFRSLWTSQQCYIDRSRFNLTQCVKGKKILIIGDSTTRQMFEFMDKVIPCEWVTDTWEKSGKHRSVRCYLQKNNEMIYDLNWVMHELPFLTAGAPKSYYRSIAVYFSELGDNEEVVIILHLHAHYLNLHSHVYHEALKELQINLLKLLKRNKVAKVVIKGPHSWAFTNESNAMLFPESYAEVHAAMLFNLLKEVHSQVYYLDAMDITVSTEQWHIHSQDYVVKELVYHSFGYICPY